jgi:S-adenosylmethionine hydrolase
MARPIIALLTDFGTRDHYVGAMKGVILTLCPEASLVDVTHEVPPHDILAGALELAACYRYFPPGTIFLVVVDPGVGSPRAGLAAEAGDFRFVAPDNGVLSAVFQEQPPRRVVVLTERRYARPTISRTFEGRDRFAPAAGWLAKGVDLAALGRATHEYQSVTIPRPVAEPGRLIGQVLRVDRFGNLVTNLDRRAVDQVASQGSVIVQVGGIEVTHLVSTYAEAEPGEACALYGSTDTLEIAVNAGHASERLGVGRGARVEVVVR